MNIRQPLPTLADRPQCSCGIAMWLSDTKRIAGGVLCTFQCPVCESFATGAVSMQTFNTHPARTREDLDAYSIPTTR